MRVFNPSFKTYKAIGTLSGTTAEIYATVQAVLDEQPTRELYFNTPIEKKQLISAGDKCIAIGFADYFPGDRMISLPLANKYEFQATYYSPIRPLYLDYRNSNYWTRKEVRHIEMGGCYNGEHGYQHLAYIYAMPLYDGLNTPSNDDLRVDAGEGKNEWGHTISSTLATTLGATVMGYYNIDATMGAKAWEDLSDDDCDFIRCQLSVFKRPFNSLLDSMDYMSNRYCGTTGLSVKDDYETRTPNTADSNEPNVNNRILGGIFQGAATLQNHEVWERVITITKEYKKEFENVLYFDLLFFSTSGGGTNLLYYGSAGNRYNDRGHTKLASGASKYTSSITGASRSLLDCWINAGIKCSMVCMGMGYAYANYDGLTRLEAQRQFKYNAGYHKPNYVGDGYVGALRFFDATIPNADIQALLAATDLVKEYYDYVYITERYAEWTSETNNFYDLINRICKYIAWGIIPDLVGDFVGTSVDADASATLALEALYQFCERASIKVVAHEMAVTAALAESFAAGHNYFPNNTFVTTPKTILASANAPDYPDGWNGGVVLSEDTGSGAVNVLHIDSDGTIFTRQYAIKPGTFALSFRAKGVGTLKIRKILNKDTYINTAGTFTEINSIAINSTADYTEYTASVIIPNAVLESYSAPATPAEEVYQNYMKGYGDKICGIQIELVIADGNYVKMGNCSLI